MDAFVSARIQVLYQEPENTVHFTSETGSSRRGCSLPTATSVINNLPRVVIQENHENLDDLTCAICNDSLSVGTVVTQLPCHHIYHPPCILPWLSARNTCPLCRFELPTDDGAELDINHNRLDLQGLDN